MNELDILPSHDDRPRELALFAGGGGGILGGHLNGWRTVCAVERDAFAAAVLAQRQNDGCLEAFPIWSDVETFDGHPWRGIVDIISGGFPCTDISCAGKGAGIQGEESGLWREFARIIGEVRPRNVLVENSPMLTVRGLGTVLGDLARLGYDAQWGCLSAADAIWLECLSRNDYPALDHLRLRIWIVATRTNVDEQHDDASRSRTSEVFRHRQETTVVSGCQDHTSADADCGRCEQHDERQWPVSILDTVHTSADATLGRLAMQWWSSSHGVNGVNGDTTGEREAWHKSKQELDQRDAIPDALGQRLERIKQGRSETRPDHRPGHGHHPGWWATEPDVGRLVHGLADRVDRCKALGNGQVPAVVRLAWTMLTETPS